MVGSVGGAGAAGLATALMKEKTAVQDVEVSLVKKGQDIEKAKGESALKLIDSAAGVMGPGHVDVHA
jgi:N-acyl-D-aspartate/D-glutamate deacylase